MTIMQKWSIGRVKIDGDSISLPLGAMPIGIETVKEECGEDKSGSVSYKYYKPIKQLIYVVPEKID